MSRLFLPVLAILCALCVASGCGDASGGIIRPPTEPPSFPTGLEPIVHTLDGRHLRFTPGSFEPNVIEHCREDGRRHTTSIFELSAITPMGYGDPLCPELTGRVLRLRLTPVEGIAIKVSTHCVDGCVLPGGYYPPLGAVVRIPWAEIAYIEFQRD